MRSTPACSVWPAASRCSHGRSPFAIEPPNAEWERELHGFGWLRHLDAARSLEVETLARELVARMDRRQPAAARAGLARWTSSPAASSPGCRTQRCCWTARDKRPYAAIMRSLDEQVMLPVGLVAQRAGRLPAPAGVDRAGEGRSVHRRPRSPARVFGAAAGRRAGAPDPPRRRPHRPQPGDPRRADARSAAAAPMLRRAQHQAGSGAAGRHRPHGADAAHTADGRRPAGPLQRCRFHRARCAGHRARLRRESDRHGQLRAAVGIPAPRARLDRDRHGRRRTARSRAWPAAPAPAACRSR